MESTGKRIILRPFQARDIDDYIRWMTVETEWMQWDAPWEDNAFAPAEYQKAKLARLEKPSSHTIYSTREIEILGTGEHIGRINAYRIDENYAYSKTGKHLAIGICIYDPKHRKRGLGTEAWLTHIHWLLENGQKTIFTQTWSGNHPVLALMQKLGFELVSREKDFQIVNGKSIDGLTFLLNKDKFQIAYREWQNAEEDSKA